MAKGLNAPMSKAGRSKGSAKSYVKRSKGSVSVNNGMLGAGSPAIGSMGSTPMGNGAPASPMQSPQMPPTAMPNGQF